MDSLWAGTNWELILSIIAGSAFLAFLGDFLGYKYGKQRVSIFGLRPRYTSHLITALTGVFISVAILTVMSIVSQDIRTTLFSMKYVQQQLLNLNVELQKSRSDTELTTNELHHARALLGEQQESLQMTTVSLDLARMDLESLRNDSLLLQNEKNALEAAVSALRGESDELKQKLETMRQESIAFHANLLLGQQAVLPNSSRARIEAVLELLKKTVTENVRSSISENIFTYGRYDLSIIYDPEEEAEMIEQLLIASEDRCYVRALCAENVPFGDPIEIRLDYGLSLLIYREGEPFYRKAVDPTRSGFDAEKELHFFLRELKKQALQDGILPEPSTHNVGTLEGEDFFDAVERLKTVQAPVIINAITLQDTYTEGPVKIRIEIEE
ncbi:MAG: DUF3084 domain-containing protein [Fretibacterium sp.]|nr:DUF3084 domain-containing protein [Fretibacterium sp.]